MFVKLVMILRVQVQELSFENVEYLLFEKNIQSTSWIFLTAIMCVFARTVFRFTLFLV